VIKVTIALGMPTRLAFRDKGKKGSNYKEKKSDRGKSNYWKKVFTPSYCWLCSQMFSQEGGNY